MKKELLKLVNDYWKEFISNNFWRGFDLDFITFLELNLDVSRETAKELDELLSKNRKYLYYV